MIREIVDSGCVVTKHHPERHPLLRYLGGFGSPCCHLPCHRGNDVHRQREDDGGILLRADLNQSATFDSRHRLLQNNMTKNRKRNACQSKQPQTIFWTDGIKVGFNYVGVGVVLAK
jgi:hypothetical protein